MKLVSDDLQEQQKGKKLAGEVREAVEEASKDEHVAVRVENQTLISADSGLDEKSSSYVVTNVTFPNDEPAPVKRSKKSMEQTASEVLHTLGFSRIASLARLRPEERQEALQKYVLEPSAMVTVC